VSKNDSHVIIMSSRRYGFYSSDACKRYGYVVYNTPQNKEVHVTEVANINEDDVEGFLSDRKQNGWRDLECVGEVTRYVLRRGPSIEQPLLENSSPKWLR